MKAAEWEVRAVEIRDMLERALDAAELDAEEHDLRRSLIDAATKNPFRAE
jgi:hypothetical protein